MVGPYPCILRLEGWGSPSTRYIFLWRKLPWMQIKPQSPTKDNRESTVPSKSPWGPGFPLGVSVSVVSVHGWGRLGVGVRAEAGGRRETPCSDYVEGICYVPFFLPPPSFFVLFLRVPLFVPFSSSPSSAFVWEDPGVFFWSTQSFSGTWVLIGWRT